MLLMNRKERERVAVMRMLEQGVVSQEEAAERMGVGTRQARRIYQRWRDEGDAGLVHRARGRPSNRRLPPDLRARALELVRAEYEDFGPTLACETLWERHDLDVRPETLRRWMRQAGLGANARRTRTKRRMRPRRRRRGELVQIDTSIHDWLEGRGEKMVLIAMIDDATSALWAEFFSSDTSQANMRLLRDYMGRFGRPEAIYCDRASHFDTLAQPDAEETYQGRRPKTQIGRALEELGVRMIRARSPQAKGRVERAFRTMQDRLVKGMRLAGVRTLAEARRHLREHFVPRWNQTWAIDPQETPDLHRPADGLDLDAIFSHQDKRAVANDMTVQHEGVVLQIDTRKAPRGLNARAEVIVERRLDNKRFIRWADQYVEFRNMGPARSRRDGRQLVFPVSDN